MESEFVANEVEHKYFFKGQPVISITDTLADQGFSDYGFLKPHDQEFYLLRGKYVAKACYLYSIGKLDWDSLAADVDWVWEYRGERFVERRTWTLPFVQSYAQLAEIHRIVPIMVEQAFYDPVYGFAGRPDLFATGDFGPGVFQLKCNGVEDWVALQTAAELRLIEASGKLPPKEKPKRWGVELQEDGRKARLYPFSGTNDLGVFLAALAVSKWQRIHGGKKNGKQKGQFNERNNGS